MNNEGETKCDVAKKPRKKRKLKNAISSIDLRKQIKAARLRGESYTSLNGKLVPAKKPEFSCSCTRKCLEKVGTGTCLSAFKRFYSIPTKNEQDVFLASLIEVYDIQRRRLRCEKGSRQSKEKLAYFKYYINTGFTMEQVCLTGFCSVFCVTVCRVRRIRNLKSDYKKPQDLRGKKANDKVLVHALVRQHIESFAVNALHSDGRLMYQLNPDVPFSRMHRDFCKQYPDLTVSESFYANYIKSNFLYNSQLCKSEVKKEDS